MAAFEGVLAREQLVSIALDKLINRQVSVVLMSFLKRALLAVVAVMLAREQLVIMVNHWAYHLPDSHTGFVYLAQDLS